MSGSEPTSVQAGQTASRARLSADRGNVPLLPMASLSLEKEGRQRSLKEQQRQPYDEDSEDNQSQASESKDPKATAPNASASTLGDCPKLFRMRTYAVSCGSRPLRI